MCRRSPSRTEGQRWMLSAADQLRPCRSRTMRRSRRTSAGLTDVRRSMGSPTIGWMKMRKTWAGLTAAPRSAGFRPWIPSIMSTSRGPSDSVGPPSRRLLPRTNRTWPCGPPRPRAGERGAAARGAGRAPRAPRSPAGRSRHAASCRGRRSVVERDRAGHEPVDLQLDRQALDEGRLAGGRRPRDADDAQAVAARGHGVGDAPDPLLVESFGRADELRHLAGDAPPVEAAHAVDPERAQPRFVLDDHVGRARRAVARPARNSRIADLARTGRQVRRDGAPELHEQPACACTSIARSSSTPARASCGASEST